MLLTFESRIIQLTFARQFFKVETDAVWFHVAHYLTEVRIYDVNTANHVIFQAFTIKSVVEPELHLAA